MTEPDRLAVAFARLDDEVGAQLHPPSFATIAHRGRRRSVTQRVALAATVMLATAGAVVGVANLAVHPGQQTLYATSGGRPAASSPARSLPSSRTYRTPASLVAAYYQAIAHHDLSRAAALLAPPVRVFYTTAPDGDFRNVVRLSAVRVGVFRPTSGIGGLPPGYGDLQEGVVVYTATLRHTITSGSGPHTVFVIVGRRLPAGPWRIVSFGSGP